VTVKTTDPPWEPLETGVAEDECSPPSARGSQQFLRLERLSFYLLTILGFSFWFFLAVPFASHRESYWWLAEVRTEPFVKAFGFISSTYRPLAQAVSWTGFLALNPHIFPTSVLRQALLQGFVYSMFVLAWWFVYTSAKNRRLFSVIACAAGGVFFSGYVHLFHIYGLSYVPVLLTLGALLRLHSNLCFEKYQVWFAAVATLLAFWHPFATGLFLAFYFGYYLETFHERSRAQHFQAVLILLACTLAVAVLVVLFPVLPTPLSAKVYAFLVSYRTNEVNVVASVVAFLLAELTVLSLELSPRLNAGALLIVCGVGAAFFAKGVPLLILWCAIALLKLYRLRYWSLFFLALAAILLPFGGGLGSPMHSLFAIIVAVYVTTLGWTKAEHALLFFRPQYAFGILAVAAVVVLLVRVGIPVPVVTKAATPLLAERERTYQLEKILAWLRNSEYCSCELAFTEPAGSPVSSVESALARRSRPPSAFRDVNFLWQSALQCGSTGDSNANLEKRTATVTFGEPPSAEASPVFEIPGRYAGDAAVWITGTQK